jgi:hypothetical protein
MACSSDVISSRLPISEAEEVRRYARRRHMNTSTLVRLALMDHMRRVG